MARTATTTTEMLGAPNHAPLNVKRHMPPLDIPMSGKSGGRIPDELKAVFLQAWEGETVHEPPKNNVAFKMFERPEAPKSTPKNNGFYLGVKPTTKLVSSRLSLKQMLSFRPRRAKRNNSNNSTRTERTTAESSCSAESLEIQVPQVVPVKQRQQKQDEPIGKQSNHSDAPLGACSNHTAASSRSKDSASRKKDRAYPSKRSPQIFLDVMMRTRGYSTETCSALETGYFNAPTPLQIDSMGSRLQSLVHSQDIYKLRVLLCSGISPNACNPHGESLLHLACRNGYEASVREMLSCGASVQVCDDSGRTVLHSAMFGTNPSLEIVKMILEKDRHLLHVKDRLGATPLSYVPRNKWGVWIDFFYRERDVLFPPKRRFDLDEDEAVLPALCKPHSMPVDDPPNALTPNLAKMVAAGKMPVEEARCLMELEDCDDFDDTTSMTRSSQHTSCWTLSSVDEDDMSSDEEEDSDDEDDSDEDDSDDDDEDSMFFM